MKPGQRTTAHWRVGKLWQVRDERNRIGVCVSVTPWGNSQVRWVRLRFPSGAEKSYAPSHLTRTQQVLDMERRRGR